MKAVLIDLFLDLCNGRKKLVMAGRGFPTIDFYLNGESYREAALKMLKKTGTSR